MNLDILAKRIQRMESGGSVGNPPSLLSFMNEFNSYKDLELENGKHHRGVEEITHLSHNNNSNDEDKDESRRTPPSSSSPSTASSTTSSSQNLTYQVPRWRDCNPPLPKSNHASLSVGSLIPEAAKLILAQSPKNRIDFVDQERSETESPNYKDFLNDLDHSETLYENDEEEVFDEECLEETPYVDYGLQVILEETESQMESDSEEESRDDQMVLDQSKYAHDPLSQFGLISEYTSHWVHSRTSSSSSPSVENESGNRDEIIMKHIRVPSDWDPEILLKRIFTIPEPQRSGGISSGGTSTLQGMEGHMHILTGNRKKGTFWNAWKRKFCIATTGKLICYEKDDCEEVFESIGLMGGKVDFLDPIEFVGPEKGKSMVNRLIGVDDGKGHYRVFQCATLGEAKCWRDILEEQTVLTKAFAIPTLPKTISVFRDILLVDFGASNVRAGILTHQPTLPALFFSSVMSENEENGRIIYGNEVYLTGNRKKAKIKFPFESSSKMCQNTVDLSALNGFMEKIFIDLNISPSAYRLILTLPRRIDKKCRQSILQLLFNTFQMRSVLMCHQSVISSWAHSAENGIVVDIGERCDVVPVSQGFVLSHAWGRAPFGGHILKHSLRQGLGPQENGLYLSTPVENLVLRFISENFVCVGSGGGTGVRKLSQDSEEIVIEMDLRDILPFSNLIGVNQQVLRGVAEGFFEPGLYGLDCDSLQKILHKSLMDCGVDIRKEMSKNIFLVGGCTQIPGFPERLETELTKLCPPHLKPTVQVSPYRYHSSFIGASVLAGTEAFEMSLLQKSDYDGGPGPVHWLI